MRLWRPTGIVPKAFVNKGTEKEGQLVRDALTPREYDRFRFTATQQVSYCWGPRAQTVDLALGDQLRSG